MTALPVEQQTDPDLARRLALMASRAEPEYRPGDGRAPGRPTKLDAQTRLRIVETVELGVPWEFAARWGGVTRATLSAWRKRGEAAAELRESGARVPKRELPYLQLWDDLEVASARAMRRVVAHWNTHFARDPRACQMFLERRFPETWGPAPLEVTGAGGGPLIDADAIIAAGLARLAQVHDALAAPLPDAPDDVVDVDAIE